MFPSLRYISSNFAADISPCLVITVLIKYVWLSFLTKEIKRLVCVIWPCKVFLFWVSRSITEIEGGRGLSECSFL